MASTPSLWCFHHCTNTDLHVSMSQTLYFLQNFTCFAFWVTVSRDLHHEGKPQNPKLLWSEFICLISCAVRDGLALTCPAITLWAIDINLGFSDLGRGAGRRGYLNPWTALPTFAHFASRHLFPQLYILNDALLFITCHCLNVLLCCKSAGHNGMTQDLGNCGQIWRKTLDNGWNNWGLKWFTRGKGS